VFRQRAPRNPGCYPGVSGLSGGQNRIPRFEGENDRFQVRFAEAIETIVGPDPDIPLPVLKNGAPIIVAQSILRSERLDRGVEFLDTAAQQFWR
jgi:hypothetical protein